MAATEQRGPIAVYGATGYTGKLVAATLERRGADYVLAGRDPEKLAALAADLGSGPRTVAVNVDDAAGLRSLLGDCATVIACAGPFILHGGPVAEAAVATGTHYLDTTGEQAFIRRVVEELGPGAERAGCALVSAMGFDYVPGDMIASLTAAGMGPLDQITLAYAVRGFGATRGTTLSAFEMMRGGDVEHRDGALRPASAKVSRGSWEFPPPVGRRQMMRYPAGEQITVPLHVETRSVRTMLTATAALPQRLAPAAPAILGPAQLALKAGPVRRALTALVSRLPEGPDPGERRSARFTIQCVARAGARERTGTISGSDVYGLTAELTVEGALRTTAAGYDRSGGLAPSQAFDPEDFLGAMAEHGVEYSVDPLPS